MWFDRFAHYVGVSNTSRETSRSPPVSRADVESMKFQHQGQGHHFMPPFVFTRQDWSNNNSNISNIISAPLRMERTAVLNHSTAQCSTVKSPVHKAEVVHSALLLGVCSAPAALSAGQTEDKTLCFLQHRGQKHLRLMNSSGTFHTSADTKDYALRGWQATNTTDLQLVTECLGAQGRSFWWENSYSSAWTQFQCP